MTDQEDKKFMVPVIIFIAVIIGLVMFNKWLQQKTDDIVARPINAPTIKPLPSPSQTEKIAQPKKRRGEVTKKTRLAPERTYEISVFYQEGEEIARHKVSGRMVYDQTGEIPDGRVKFTNESNETYGAEFYRDGERHGPAKTYYKEGQLERETDYLYGRLMTSKEYYIDGIARMEEDYNDARERKGKGEVGTGKVYFRDGTIKYEWHLTNSDPIGFNKSYNRNGELVAEIYRDEYGQIIPPQKAISAQTADNPPGVGYGSDLD